MEERKDKIGNAILKNDRKNMKKGRKETRKEKGSIER